MNETKRIRVLLHAHGSGTDIFRTLVSLACQDIGARRVEIALASASPELHDGREARLLYRSLDFNNVQVLDARGLSFAQAMNLAAADGDAEHLALAPEGARLYPRFLSRCLAMLCGRHTSQAAFGVDTPADVDSILFTRRLPFRPEQLVRRNAVGQTAVIQRTAWDILCGLRPGLEYSLWDFWLRLALQGGRFRQAAGALASCPARQQHAPEQDGRAKALLVVHTPGAFEPDVCRWALALLRGEAWAAPHLPGVIPAPRDVAALFAGEATPLRPGWDQRQRRSA